MEIWVYTKPSSVEPTSLEANFTMLSIDYIIPSNLIAYRVIWDNVKWTGIGSVYLFEKINCLPKLNLLIIISEWKNWKLYRKNSNIIKKQSIWLIVSIFMQWPTLKKNTCCVLCRVFQEGNVILKREKMLTDCESEGKSLQNRRIFPGIFGNMLFWYLWDNNCVQFVLLVNN